MEMVVVAYRKVGQPLGRQQDDMKEELGRLGFEGAAGFDPDETNKSISVVSRRTSAARRS
jgi:hypothetical protein